MSGADTPNDDTPQAAPPGRALVITVWVLGFGIVAMVFLLFFGVMLGWHKKDSAAAPADPTVRQAAPAGVSAVLEIETAPESRLYTLAGDGTRIALHIAAPTGDEIVVIDTSENRVVSRVKLKPGASGAP
jgi:hypothetical protein